MRNIVVFGDSIAYGKWDSRGGWVARLRATIDHEYNLETRQNILVYNLSKPGELAITLLNRFESELQSRLRSDANSLVLLAIGANDACSNNRTTQCLTPKADFTKAMTTMFMQTRSLNCQLGCIGLSPCKSEDLPSLQFTNETLRAYDDLLTQICVDQKVAKLNLFDALLQNGYTSLLRDGIHPNDDGHQLLFEIIKPFIIQLQTET